MRAPNLWTVQENRNLDIVSPAVRQGEAKPIACIKRALLGSRDVVISNYLRSFTLVNCEEISSTICTRGLEWATVRVGPGPGLSNLRTLLRIYISR